MKTVKDLIRWGRTRKGIEGRRRRRKKVPILKQSSGYIVLKLLWYTQSKIFEDVAELDDECDDTGVSGLFLPAGGEGGAVADLFISHSCFSLRFLFISARG